MYGPRPIRFPAYWCADYSMNLGGNRRWVSPSFENSNKKRYHAHKFYFSLFTLPTGSPSSKYEHRRASALLRNIQIIRICMGKKPIFSVTYEIIKVYQGWAL